MVIVTVRMLKVRGNQNEKVYFLNTFENGDYLDALLVFTEIVNKINNQSINSIVPET